MAQQAVDTITDHERLAGLHIDAHTLLNTPSVLAADNQVALLDRQGNQSIHSLAYRIAVDKIRKRLQEYPSAQSIQPVINAGLVPDVVALLESHDGDFQIAAASMVTNIASGSSQQTCSVVEAGAIPSLRRLATAANEELAETAVLALGNITADSAALRDAVEKQGCVETILDILQNDTSADKVRRKALWVIACYLNPGLTPKLSLERAKVALPSIIKSIQETLPTPGNMDALRYAIEALDRICRLDLSRLDLIQTGIVPKLVQLISDSSSSVEVCKHALGCLGYLAWGTDLEAEVAINAGLPAALPAHLLQELQSKSKLFWIPGS
ncbi:hypothetical protein FRB90_004826 [Tulasnella sp. 427]|nr:hypothetical protein FRB90_004826 [Tulasnella sp. 427]